MHCAVRPLLFVLVLCVAAISPAPEYERLAPYPAIRWTERVPEVRVDGRWYRLRGIGQLDTERIVEFCVKTYGARWQKRFDEDLVEVLTRIGQPPGRTVDLRVEDVETGERAVLRRVPMTRENRRAIWEARARERGRAHPRRATVQRRVRREHSRSPAKEFLWINHPNVTRDLSGGPVISRTQAEQDLDELEWHIEHRFSYRDRLGLDYRAALDTIRTGLAENVAVRSLTLQLIQVMALFGDGHSRLEVPSNFLLQSRFAPFLLADAKGGVVAFRPSRDGLLVEGHPYVVSIDGIDLERWIEAAKRFVVRGAPHFQRREALRLLRQLAALRPLVDVRNTGGVTLELRSPGGRLRRIELPLTGRYPVYGEWPRARSRVIEGDVGYLRVPSMRRDPRSLSEVHYWMGRFAATRGLIIDVRGNGGGSRDTLRALLPYFLRRSDGPRVVNVAACRLGPDDARDAREGYLRNRFLYPLSSREWSPAARRAIRAVARRFEPRWRPARDDFSAWHYMVVEPPARDAPPAYGGPVVVLLDGGCFSATDILLGAFKGLPGVTLLGTPSGGGSGRARGVRLEHSGIRLRLSSMASFRPDGRLYDGSGIAPDVLVEPEPEYFIGREDSQLAAAIERLARGRRRTRVE